MLVFLVVIAAMTMISKIDTSFIESVLVGRLVWCISHIKVLILLGILRCHIQLEEVWALRVPLILLLIY